MRSCVGMDTKHQLKIGDYVLGETLGKGTFGKVKGDHLNLFTLSSHACGSARTKRLAQGEYHSPHSL